MVLLSYLASNLVGPCSCALEMLGNYSDTLTKLKEKYPKIILWHCMCHRVELAIEDAIKPVTQVNHVKFFLSNSTPSSVKAQKLSVNLSNEQLKFILSWWK